MRRLEFHSYGSPEVLRIVEVEQPVPGEGEVLVQIAATAINPSDVKNVAGSFNSPLPRVPGRDFAGVVVAGPVESGLEVWGSGAGFGVRRDGCHAEFVTMPAEWYSAKPPSLSMEQAAAIGVPYVTAWTALVRVGLVKPGETVLVIGATGSVGRAATQIAQWQGARVIGASRSARNLWGADAIVGAEAERMDEEVRAVTDGRGADLVLDAVGGPLFEAGLRSLRPEGRQIAITSPGERRVSFDLIDFYRNRSRLLGVNTMALGGVETAEILDELRHGFEGGYLTAPEVTPWPLERAVEAYAACSTGGSSAKHVLIP
jgi:NADPH:quinone reductase-like Zn-dependent oxidoreductase